MGGGWSGGGGSGFGWSVLGGGALAVAVAVAVGGRWVWLLLVSMRTWHSDVFLFLFDSVVASFLDYYASIKLVEIFLTS